MGRPAFSKPPRSTFSWEVHTFETTNLAPKMLITQEAAHAATVTG